MYHVFFFPLGGFALILVQVMRAAGLGVVVEVGPGSMFNVGDRVTGSWGVFPVLPFYISLLYIRLLGMTEYAVMKDSKLEKIVYVCLPLLVNLPYISVIIDSVYHMASNLLISWAHLDCQVSSLGESF